MKNLFLKKVSIAVFVVGLLSSCSDTEKKFRSCPIRFSSDILNFDVNGGNRVIESNSENWWFSLLFIDDVEFTIGRLLLVCDEKKGVCELVVLCEYLYDREHPGQQLPIEQVRCNPDDIWFSMTVKDEARSDKRLSISVKPNDTGKDRHAFFEIQAGNCTTELLITQSAE